MPKRSLGIKTRFSLVLVILAFSLIAVGAAGIVGLRAERGNASRLYLNNVQTAEDASNLGANLDIAHAATLELLLDLGHSAATAPVSEQLQSSISTDVDVGIASVRPLIAGNARETKAINTIASGWRHLQELRAIGGLSNGSPSAIAIEVNQVESTYDPMTAAANTIVQVEGIQAREAYESSLTSYAESVHLMMLATFLGLFIALGMVAFLTRSVLTRTLSYSDFARSVSEGDLTKHLEPRGDDELEQLGIALEQLARRRESAELYDEKKRDFSDMLQVTENETEAHTLLKRYLERSVANCNVTILNRNNSADRLEAMTEPPIGSVLLQSLEDAKPRSCLAIRMNRPHVSAGDTDLLMSCLVCSACPGRTMCTPLLVGGKVIGSVLAIHEKPLSDYEGRSMREAVMQAAPVLGNLRSLAIAELRSATDVLTGLPNRRAIEGTLKRMVAQASRTVTPLAALMCDIDHFKHVNDQFGHGSGDDLLAAVGAALIDSMRAADFAGRYGGEEFLILLPATGPEGARQMANKIRTAVADIRVPTVPRRITLSVGIAVLPDHANDAGSLERTADRALYAAKNAGRDRIEMFNTEGTDLGLLVEVAETNGAIESTPSL
jgi:diguanylate cyclase (GGDEF)-like protein